MAFNPILIGLGTIKPRVNITFHFDYDEEVSLITNIHVPCDCTRVVNNIPDRMIVVDYTPNDIPYHLLKMNKNCYDTVKNITISYLNTSGAVLNQALVFTATIKR